MKMKNLTIILIAITLITLNKYEGAKLFKSGDTYITPALKEATVKTKQTDLDSYYSEKKLGSFIDNGKTYFRIFVPSAVKVTLCTFKDPNDKSGKEYEMTRDEDAVWEVILDGELRGLFYGFKVYHEGDDLNNGNKVICVDPYAKAVATYNTYMNPRRSIVYDKEYNWEDDEWIQNDWRDLIIYEMHIRDMTKHPSAGAKHPGTYKGLTEKNIKGGLQYIKNLGVNTVELLPAQEFGCIEIPFEDSIDSKYNTWNPYERNYWGYMTSNFFAPEAYYAQDWDKLKWNTWMGSDGQQVNEFKDMIKAFHKEGIAVIMDVVYNHLSEYEIGNLKQFDKEYYFRLNADGSFLAESGCGNDLKTERPMVRRLIVESILYWMQEYHVDGFRFDLGKLIDWETVEEIIYEAKKINPNVVIVCEPWGGGYDPKGFSLRGWGAWNDQIRNGIKGENPLNGLGWIFGKWYGNNNIDRIKSYVNGTLVRDKHGLFQTKEHSVNYLESHDGYTFGDFIRIALDKELHDAIIKDITENAKLTPMQLKLNKLGALFLFTSQGITMIHAGQEYARSKVIPQDIDVPDHKRGQIDHNSYEKDNATNYLNFDHADFNKELLDYYQGLIELRKTYSAFRHAGYKDITFFEQVNNPFALAYSIDYKDQHFFIAFNSSDVEYAEFALPEGEWELLVGADKAGVEPQGVIKEKIGLDMKVGAVLKRKVKD